MIRVWLQAVPALPAMAEHDACLSEAEAARASNMRCPQQRESYITIHRWMHARVAEVLGVPASRLPLRIDRCGAPVLDGFVHDLCLSHHEDRVALAVSDGEPVGIDVLTVPTDVGFVADTGLVLSADEIMLVRSATPERRGPLFATCWTRKEAYGKLLRTGLTDGLDGLTLTTSPERAAGARFWTARFGDAVLSVATDVAVPLDIAVVP
jgi:4'-phosphopantetheinyl transferase